jgi:preprotein translocase subunit SecA
MAIPRGIAAGIQLFFGGPVARRLARWGLLVPKVERCESELSELDPEQLRKHSLALRYRAKSGEALERLLPEAFALVRIAAERTLGLRHYDVQLVGGAALHAGCVAEMQTGEGKTLTATLPLYLNALTGKGVHLATANDYLARRDAEWMGPIYQALGFSVGVIEAQMPQDSRRRAYACDITYGTAKEFGFDFLRDRLLLRRAKEGSSDLVGGMLGRAERAVEQPVQRGQHYIVVDEADSLLIDEARTPLIISAMPGEQAKIEEACYIWAAGAAEQFAEGRHYEYKHDKKAVELTAPGRQLVRSLPKPPDMNTVGMVSIYKYIERAIKVLRDYRKDREYVIRDGEIVIVDEFTGRLGEGRKWRDGIHQAIEAKEGVKVTVDAGHAAQITVQELFGCYERLAGMTGTAVSSARELRKVYRTRVVPVPTNRACIRRQWPTMIFGTADDKWEAIVAEVRNVHEEGRPILIGTRSIDKSEHLSRLLRAAEIGHQVLNAKQIAAEAEIVKLAGEPGKVTVATNMAGRGTDIRLGSGVAELGGLHVICTEMHDSARIDRQLIGRCARQGDPGTYRQFLALDDEILTAGLGPKKGARLKTLGQSSPGPFALQLPLFRRAQRRVERRYFRDRRKLMYYVKQRKKMLTQMGQDPYLDTPG